MALDADHTAGGVLIMWDSRDLERLEVLVGSFSVLVQWQWWMVLFGCVSGSMAQMVLV